MDSDRTQLVRELAEFDQLAAKMEETANDPHNEDRIRARAMLILMDKARKNVEEKLRGE